MRTLSTWIMTLLLAGQLQAQEVYLVDFTLVGDKALVQRVQNISRNPGYDNQPAFSPDGLFLYYASVRNGQNDILRYGLADSNKTWITQTRGSEYSPTPLPAGSGLSAIKLDEDGYQRLWRFSASGQDSSLVHPDLKIGYHLWLSKDSMVCFVLDTERSNSLNIIDLAKGSRQQIHQQPGRSIHKIPCKAAFSYVDKSESTHWKIMEYDLSSGEVRSITRTINGSVDYCWTPAGNILMGQGSMLYWYNPNAGSGWVPLANLADYGIRNITRLALNPQGNKLALVAAE